MIIATYVSKYMSFEFRSLDVYKRTLGLITKVNSLCELTPKMQYFLSEQLKRAALSIIANISEGSGRWHSKDKRYFYLISRGSAYECVAIIDSYCRIHQHSEEMVSEIVNDLEDISKMLTKLIQRYS